MELLLLVQPWPDNSLITLFYCWLIIALCSEWNRSVILLLVSGPRWLVRTCPQSWYIKIDVHWFRISEFSHLLLFQDQFLQCPPEVDGFFGCRDTDFDSSTQGMVNHDGSAPPIWIRDARPSSSPLTMVQSLKTRTCITTFPSMI